MPGVNFFKKITNVEDALEIFLRTISPISRKYVMELDYVDNRVLASDVIAPKDYPHYDQSYMDGYAVISEDTAGCSADNPVSLALIDGGRVMPGHCLQVHTGSAVPEGADAVVRLEDVDVHGSTVLILKEAIKGQNFTPQGSEVKKGELVFPEGRQLKPTDIAMLASLGISEAEVYERPRVLVIPTGDEVLERGKVAGPGEVNESNGLMCHMYVKRFGGKAYVWDLVPDDVDKLKNALMAGMNYDLIITSGGTSVGKRDHMRELVESMGKVLVHGVGLKPGRPLGLGYIEENGRRVPIIFLPGFPDACAIGALTFAAPAIRKLGHYPPLRYPEGSARLGGSIRTYPGSRSIVKLRLDGDKAIPVPTVGASPWKGEYTYAVIQDDTEGRAPGDVLKLEFLE